MTCIFACDEYTGEISRLAEFSLKPKDSLLYFIAEHLGNKNLPEIRESQKAPNHWYFDDLENNRVLAAYPF